MCEQSRTDLEDRNMEQEERFGDLVWGVAKEKDVAIGSETANDIRAGWCVDGVALGAGRDFAVVADTDTGLLAPDIRPPGTLGCRANNGAFFSQSLPVCGLWHLAQFTMAQFDAVEVEGLAELGEDVWIVGIKEGVVADIERQRQAMGLKDAGEEIEMGQQAFSVIEARASVQACGIVKNIQEDLFVGAIGQPGMRRGVVLPQGAVITGLPAFDGFGRDFETCVWSQVIFNGRSANTGAVGFEVEAAEQFAGDSIVGARWFGREQFGDQGGDFDGPLRMMIAAGESGRPAWPAAQARRYSA